MTVRGGISYVRDTRRALGRIERGLSLHGNFWVSVLLVCVTLAGSVWIGRNVARMGSRLVLLVLVAELALLFLHRPEWGIAATCVLALTTGFSILLAGTMWGRLYRIVLPITIMALILREYRQGTLLSWLRLRPGDHTLVLFLLLAGLSLRQAVSQTAVFDTLIVLVKGVALYMVVTRGVTCLQDLKSVFRLVAVVVIITSVIGGGQFWGLIANPDEPLSLHGVARIRSTGTLADPNLFATRMLLLLPCFFWLLQNDSRSWRQVASLAIAGVL